MQRLRAENAELRQESQQLPDLESVRVRYLSNLRFGKQAPEYKRTKSTLDKFIAFAQKQ